MPDLPSPPTATRQPGGPRVVFVGTPGRFSPAPLAALLAGGVDVRAVVIPRPPAPSLATGPAWRPLHSLTRSPLSVLADAGLPAIPELAGSHGVPVFTVATLTHPGIAAELRRLRPDLVCVACLPWRVPPALLEIPGLGWLNLHPSLLPNNRGPAPLFWTFRLGARLTGVTVHLMDEGWDTGDIVAQEALDVPEGVYGSHFEQTCAALGARLMLQSVSALANGSAVFTSQDLARGSYHSWPRPGDFQLPTTRSARWAFNFIRGIDNWASRPEVQAGGERFPLRAALSFSASGDLGRPFLRRGRELWVQFHPGILHAEAL